MALEKTKVESGFYYQEPGNFSTKNVIEDFMKTEYQEGLRNEFNMMDALINRLAKDTISGKKKYKSFALGVADNVRAVGQSFDRYELGFDTFYNKGVETVEAEFDTTKLMATFAITDEAILKGTGDGSLLDVLKDSLDRMEISLKHTMNRFTYGAPDGKIGAVKNVVSGGNAVAGEYFEQVSITPVATKPSDPRGAEHNEFYGAAGPVVVKFKMKNSHSLLPGMGIMVELKSVSSATESDVTTNTGYNVRLVGRIWQKDNSAIHDESVIMFVDKVLVASGTSTGSNAISASYSDNNGGTSYLSTLFTASTGVLATFKTNATVDGASVSAIVYSRQLDDAGAVNAEYHGLEAILNPTGDARYEKIFGVDRSIYSSLKNTVVDLNHNSYLTEETLRDMSDHLALTSPDGTSINLVCSNHRIISTVEKAMMQFKETFYTQNSSGYQLGRPDIKFDNFVLVKDKYARDENVYMLDQTKIGELVRRDFTWITSGEVNSVLQRRPGTELYEGIMNKYADMYIDAWRCHGIITNVKVPAVGAAVTQYSYPVKVVNSATEPVPTDEV